MVMHKIANLAGASLFEFKSRSFRHGGVVKYGVTAVLKTVGRKLCRFESCPLRQTVETKDKVSHAFPCPTWGMSRLRGRLAEHFGYLLSPIEGKVSQVFE